MTKLFPLVPTALPASVQPNSTRFDDFCSGPDFEFDKLFHLEGGLSVLGQQIQGEEEALFVSDDETQKSGSNLVLSPKGMRYQLRPGIRENFHVPISTWVDQDISGDFDPYCAVLPEVEAGKQLERPKRPSHWPPSDSEAQGKRPKLPPTAKFAKQNGLQFPIMLKLKTEKNLVRFRELMQDGILSENGEQRGRDNWTIEPSKSEENSTLLTSTAVIKNRLRTRPNTQKTANGLVELGLGHVEARGCKHCYKNKDLLCSLIAGGKYPCGNCFKEQHDCELFLEPPLKAKCEGCKRSRSGKCTFVTSPSKRGPCAACCEKGWPCITGPANGRTRTGVTYDCKNIKFNKATKLSKSSQPAIRKVVGEDVNEWSAGVATVRTEILGRWSDHENYRNHKDHDNSTTQSDVSLISKGNSQPQHQENASPARDRYMMSGALPICKPLKTIRTRFTHPITINHSSEKECLWCTEEMRPLIGDDERVVLVEESSEGYHEVGGKLASPYDVRPKMCQKCTTARVIVMICEGHMMLEMEQKRFSTDKVLSLNTGKDTKDVLNCAVCLNSATHRCAREQGCGLLLCGSCAGDLEKHQGQLGEIIKEKDKDQQAMAKVRADAFMFDHIMKRLS